MAMNSIVNMFQTLLIPKVINLNLEKKIEPKILWVRAFHEVYNPDMALDVIQII